MLLPVPQGGDAIDIDAAAVFHQTHIRRARFGRIRAGKYSMRPEDAQEAEPHAAADRGGTRALRGS